MALFTRRVSVVLDTNALLLFQDHVDLFSEIEALMERPCRLLIPKQVMAELETMAKRTSKSGRGAKLALGIIEAFTRSGGVGQLIFRSGKEIPLKIAPVSGVQHADDAILKIAEDAACTLDKELQGRLLAKGVRVIAVKQKRLAFV